MLADAENLDTTRNLVQFRNDAQTISLAPAEQVEVPEARTLKGELQAALYFQFFPQTVLFQSLVEIAYTGALANLVDIALSLAVLVERTVILINEKYIVRIYLVSNTFARLPDSGFTRLSSSLGS